MEGERLQREVASLRRTLGRLARPSNSSSSYAARPLFSVSQEALNTVSLRTYRGGNPQNCSSQPLATQKATSGGGGKGGGLGRGMVCKGGSLSQCLLEGKQQGWWRQACSYECFRPLSTVKVDGNFVACFDGEARETSSLRGADGREGGKGSLEPLEHHRIAGTAGEQVSRNGHRHRGGSRTNRWVPSIGPGP